jgi:hypothetical protein
LAQQKIEPFDSRPWPMIRVPQWLHVGAIAEIAHSKLSKVWDSPARVTSNDLS